MKALTSIALSLAASAAATYLLRQIVTAGEAPESDGAGPSRPRSTVVVIVPVFTGNSNNHLWHIERRGFFRR